MKTGWIALDKTTIWLFNYIIDLDEEANLQKN